MTNEELQLLANAARHGLSKAVIDAPIQYVLNVTMVIAKVEKLLKDQAPLEKNESHG